MRSSGIGASGEPPPKLVDTHSGTSHSASGLGILRQRSSPDSNPSSVTNLYLSSESCGISTSTTPSPVLISVNTAPLSGFQFPTSARSPTSFTRRPRTSGTVKRTVTAQDTRRRMDASPREAATARRGAQPGDARCTDQLTCAPRMPMMAPIFGTMVVSSSLNLGSHRDTLDCSTLSVVAAHRCDVGDPRGGWVVLCSFRG
mmetsp:Transcript_29593/g.56863  ORF Transcript_29593/g.56863 Transcript_29593/m.56863 type:complete len:201 (-) Transcript_29593:3-605(-)